MDCNKSKNISNCNCSYDPCSRKGVCCDCLQYHLRAKELPACVFPNDVEKSYNRSFRKFAELVMVGKV